MFYIFSIVLILFSLVNIFIVYFDMKKKKILNKYLIFLLYLLPVYLFSIAYLSQTQVEISFIIQLIISVIVTFLLYYFWIWWAWDAKYLLVLSLFIPHIWIVPFIANISLVTLAYLALYFLYFYGKNIINIIYWDKTFLNSIITDFKERYYYSIGIKKDIFQESIIRLTIIWILKFLFIFLLIRVSKIYLFDPYVENNYYRYIQDNQILWFLSQNPVYSFLLLFLIIFIFYFVLIFVYKHISDFLDSWLYKILKSLKINTKYTSEIILFLSFILLSSYLFYEYLIHPSELISNLVLIGTYYFAILIFVKIMIYMYKITFQVAEEKIIPISKLKAWDIIDKKFLIKNLWNENCLWAHNNKKWIFYPSPKKYFITMDNPINNEDKMLLQKAYNILNKHHKWNNNFVDDLVDIKILKTFPFAIFIFVWFLLTYFYQDQVFQYILDIVKSILKSLYWV